MQRENNNVSQTTETTRCISGTHNCQTTDSIHSLCIQLIDQRLNDVSRNANDAKHANNVDTTNADEDAKPTIREKTVSITS